MQVCIIHGSPRKQGNTAQVVDAIKKHLNQYETHTYEEFYLNNQTLSFCNGCYKCFFDGEDTCPHVNQVAPLLQAMLKADGVIITTPVYVLCESGQAKAFMDHLAYQFLPHRPNDGLFQTVGLAVATTVGASTKPAIKAIRKNMRFWGFIRTMGLGLGLYGINWEEAPKAKQRAFQKKSQKTAKSFYKLMKRRHHIRFNPFRRMMMLIMGKMHRGTSDTLDKRYWIKKGWIRG